MVVKLTVNYGSNLYAGDRVRLPAEEEADLLARGWATPVRTGRPARAPMAAPADAPAAEEAAKKQALAAAIREAGGRVPPGNARLDTYERMLAEARQNMTQTTVAAQVDKG